ncbi:universal stress protein [Desulfurococcaceae archaeon MEX13E-LK6-19]|nr:universal stress protein [Desulfurococcaceae archaeon MEX13E-LK6-19]
MEHPFSRILVAFDGSVYAKKALNIACALSLALGCRVRVVHVVDTTHVGIMVSGIGIVLEKSLLEKGRSLIIEAKELAKKHGVDVEVSLRRGHPADEIIREAKEWKADLIIMGSRGLGGFEKLLLGSVSDSVARLAPCPVLIVR